MNGKATVTQKDSNEARRQPAHGRMLAAPSDPPTPHFAAKWAGSHTRDPRGPLLWRTILAARRAPLCDRRRLISHALLPSPCLAPRIPGCPSPIPPLLNAAIRCAALLRGPDFPCVPPPSPDLTSGVHSYSDNGSSQGSASRPQGVHAASRPFARRIEESHAGALLPTLPFRLPIPLHTLRTTFSGALPTRPLPTPTLLPFSTRHLSLGINSLDDKSLGRRWRAIAHTPRPSSSLRLDHTICLPLMLVDSFRTDPSSSLRQVGTYPDLRLRPVSTASTSPA